MTTAAISPNDFATRLGHRLAQTQAGKDLFLSPFSVQVALAMCAVGARGQTRKVLTDLIGAPESVEEQNRKYAEMIGTVMGAGDRPFELDTANALWGQRGFGFNPDFVKTIADFYDGSFNEVDYNQREEAAKTINSWVSQKTRERIPELINREFITPLTRLIVTNAIYFKGKWAMPFDQANTRNEAWRGPNGTRSTPMMHREGSYHYFEEDGFQALDLPYLGDQLSMLVVLPRNKEGLAELETRWASEDLYQQVTAGLSPTETVIVSLPRFKLETSFMLKPELTALGAGLIFTQGADFSNISTEGRLAVSEVVHKAFVEVNEEGTEAAAATGVGFFLVSAPPPPTVFQADHPFLFFIRDRKSNAVLFSGRLLDPK
jgi:serpin B